MNIYIQTLLVALLFLTSCETPKRPKSKTLHTLLGEGSSMLLPLSHTLFKQLNDKRSIYIDYKTKDSFSGIESLINDKVDFALSSIPLTDEMSKQHPDILHIPIAAAGINFAYNLPGEEFSLLSDPVYLTPEILAKILNQKITKWNDPEIIDLNQKVAENKSRVFPNLPIIFVQRSADSGDTLTVTRFLSKATKEWKKGIIPKLPTNTSTKLGTTSLDLILKLMETPGSITYAPMIYGVQNNLPLIRIKNHFGIYGRGCDFRTVEAMRFAEIPNDNRADLTYPTKEGRESGVATSLVYILVKKEQNYNNKTLKQAQNLVDLIDWLLLPSAQQQLQPIFFAGLTPPFRQSARTMLSNITYNGTQILPSSPNKIGL